MRDSVMLYKYPGQHEIHGDKFDYIIVPESKSDLMLKAGWYLTTEEAKSAEQDTEEKERLRFEDFSELEKENISNDPRPMKLLAEIHNTGYHVIRKIKGKT